jgi:hypothetical protein
VERQRFQTVENLERMLVITAFLTVRLLQLRERLDAPIDAPETVLSKDEWKVLWLSTEHNHPLPKMPLSARWVFPPLQNWVDLLIPSARDAPAGTLFGTVGFACENGSMGNNSASRCSLSCDQETGLCRGLTYY